VYVQGREEEAESVDVKGADAVRLLVVVLGLQGTVDAGGDRD